jgi:hypothetical protein
MLVAAAALAAWATGAAARPAEPPRLAHPNQLDLAGAPAGTAPVAGKAAQDTVWIADWSFDEGSPCTSTGWEKYDNRIQNDGTNYWCVSAAYDTCATLTGNAARLARHDLCWARDGYGNNWDYAIVLAYRGGAAGGGTAPTLSFSYAADTEANYDFVTVEGDSLGLSAVRVNYSLDPRGTPAALRREVFRVDGLVPNGQVTALPLVDFTPTNAAATHTALIRFTADAGNADEDGGYPTLYRAGLIVDNVVVGGTLAYSESFTGASGCANPATGVIAGAHANLTFRNTGPATPFGEWARLYRHATDNDKCTENTTCAWIASDPSLPAYFADMAFGPGGTVVRNWLDDITVSPWVSLASTPAASGTVITWRRLGGNDFARGRIVEGWRVRSKVRVANTDTSTLGDSIDCVTPWVHTLDWNALSSWVWDTTIGDLSSDIPPTATEIQISLRRSDWQWIAGATPPATLNTGPGPYDDRVRIGRRVLEGPVIQEGVDSRSQSQDAFGAVQNSITPGQHHSPSTGPTRRFDAVPFNAGQDLGIGDPGSPNLITGDSVHVEVNDVRGVGGVTSVQLYAAIVAGPHAGKVPPGAAPGPGGFFVVPADSARGSSGQAIADRWFADLPDDYLRGGDQLVYFWGATDAAGGFASDPAGIPGTGAGPAVASLAQAEALTGGLLGMNALPAITWAPAYLAAVNADPEGDVAPTAEQIAASTQTHCILYSNQFTSRRRSGSLQRTSFMYTLDRVGYRDHYDVYDVQGYGNTNNQLGGRATVGHATGYALIVQDTGSLASATVTDGSDTDTEKIDQANWYRTWLANGVSSTAGSATLWIVGENVAQEKGTNPLFSADFGVALGNSNNGTATPNPDVLGIANFAFENGCVGPFLDDRFSLQGGCPTIRNYDGLTATTGTATHRYRAGTINSTFAAVVMNSNPALDWNTILSSFGWYDIRDPFGGAPGRAEQDFLGKVLQCVLPAGCLENETVDAEPGPGAAPARTVLHANVPNPFNPTTEIRFDLARDGRVAVRIFDVSGRRIRTLADGPMRAGGGWSLLWDGLDDGGRRAPSGVYFCRLEAGETTATRRMVLLK